MHCLPDPSCELGSTLGSDADHLSRICESSSSPSRLPVQVTADVVELGPSGYSAWGASTVHGRASSQARRAIQRFSAPRKLLTPRPPGLKGVACDTPVAEPLGGVGHRGLAAGVRPLAVRSGLPWRAPHGAARAARQQRRQQGLARGGRGAHLRAAPDAVGRPRRRSARRHLRAVQTTRCGLALRPP